MVAKRRHHCVMLCAGTAASFRKTRRLLVGSPPTVNEDFETFKWIPNLLHPANSEDGSNLSQTNSTSTEIADESSDCEVLVQTADDDSFDITKYVTESLHNSDASSESGEERSAARSDRSKTASNRSKSASDNSNRVNGNVVIMLDLVESSTCVPNESTSSKSNETDSDGLNGSTQTATCVNSDTLKSTATVYDLPLEQVVRKKEARIWLYWGGGDCQLAEAWCM